MMVSRWSDLLIPFGLLLLVGALLLPSTWRQGEPVRQIRSTTDAAANAAERVPVRVAAPDVGLDAPVDPVGIATDGALALPGDPGRAGWWIGGATAGDGRGSAVIAGHVDNRDGLGAMFALHRLEPGMRVRVQTADGHSVTYAVTGLQRYHKKQLPQGLFTDAGAHRLVLITCGGPFNAATRSYRDNVVVTADRALS